jgi:hypothetical protein
MSKHVGLPELQEMLVEKGFSLYPDYLKDKNDLCNWVACRYNTAARPCETNDRTQVVIKPFDLNFDGRRFSSVEIEITGEYAGEWWKLQRYSISPEELEDKLDKIENKLVMAWNALGEKHEG